MRQHCDKCHRRYDDEFCSTCCPHKGIGFCVVCDCAICVCSQQHSSDWKRSANNGQTN